MLILTDVLPAYGFDSIRIFFWKGEIPQNTGNAPGNLDRDTRSLSTGALHCGHEAGGQGPGESDAALPLPTINIIVITITIAIAIMIMLLYIYIYIYIYI